MAKKYHFGAVRLLGLLAILYGVTGVITDLSGIYAFPEFTGGGFIDALISFYSTSSVNLFRFAYFFLFALFGVMYTFNTKPSMKKAGFNPKAYAMIGFAFLFTLQNLVYFTTKYPFDFSIPDEFSWNIVKTYVMSVYCTVGEVLMIAALMNYLRGGKVIRIFLLVAFIMAFILAAVDGLVGIEGIIEAVEASNGGFTEVSKLIYKLSLIIITFFLMMFSFSHDHILVMRKKVNDDDAREAPVKE